MTHRQSTGLDYSSLDRLLHHCRIVITDGNSYRMKQARAKGGIRLKTS